ncbi:MAG: DUF58 domain-containing protein [Actinomycetota bacterium]
MPRLRPRAAGLVFGAVLLFGIGTSVQAGWLLVLASCLLGTVIAGVFLPLRMLRGVEVERRAPAEAFQGDRVEIDLVLTNRGRGTRPALLVHDEHVAPSTAFVSRLGAGETLVVSTLRPAARRGVHTSSEVVLASAAPFGVAVKRRRLAVPGETVVYPAVVPLRELPFLGASPTAERALHTMPRRGTGPDYLGIREYRWGDSMRHVHWPSTARHGELMVREFEREETRRLAVVVDAAADVGEGVTPLDRCCSIAASIAFAAAGRGQGVRLIAAAGGEPVVLHRAQPVELLRRLAELRPSGGPIPAELLPVLGAELQGVDTVVLALPTWRFNGTPALVEAVGDVCARVPRVVIALVEAHTFEAVAKQRTLDAAELEELGSALAVRGALVCRVGAEDDLAVALGRLPLGVLR